jgi:poly-gamma-glutamate capsule biosynthesis protein CapA/YwtB (metallophosphatase superfamily)
MRIVAITILAVVLGLTAGAGLRYTLDQRPVEHVLAAPAAVPAPPQPKQVTLVAVGDVLLDKQPGRLMEKLGVDYPFADTTKISRSADIAICNLECCVAECGYPMNKQYTFRAKPDTLRGLVDAGYDIVSVANNHTLDYGRQAFAETMENLAKHGLEYVGGGASVAEAHEPKVLECETMKVAFLAYDALAEEGVFPRSDVPGIAHVDPELVRKGVRKARQMADAVVVYFHWGVEGAYAANERQGSIAHVAADAGADLIIGSHPHVVQNVAEYTPPGSRKRVPIVYSLGNFVWGQRTWVKDHSAILRCTLTPDGVKALELLPVRITSCRPSVAQKPPRSGAPQRK